MSDILANCQVNTNELSSRLIGGQHKLNNFFEFYKDPENQQDFEKFFMQKFKQTSKNNEE